jgi:pilus assembly protein Flp/PilA
LKNKATRSGPPCCSALEILMRSRFWQVVGDESGATSIEYALIATLVAVAIIGSVSAVGDSLSGVFAAVVAGFG